MQRFLKQLFTGIFLHHCGLNTRQINNRFRLLKDVPVTKKILKNPLLNRLIEIFSQSENQLLTVLKKITKNVLEKSDWNYRGMDTQPSN